MEIDACYLFNEKWVAFFGSLVKCGCVVAAKQFLVKLHSTKKIAGHLSLNS